MHTRPRRPLEFSFIPKMKRKTADEKRGQVTQAQDKYVLKFVFCIASVFRKPPCFCQVLKIAMVYDIKLSKHSKRFCLGMTEGERSFYSKVQGPISKPLLKKQKCHVFAAFQRCQRSEWR